MFTNRQEELEARIEEAQAEIAAIEETKNASKKECKDCQEKLDAIPHADRKVTAILVHKDGTNTGGLMFHGFKCRRYGVRYSSTESYYAIP